MDDAEKKMSRKGSMKERRGQERPGIGEKAKEKAETGKEPKGMAVTGTGNAPDAAVFAPPHSVQGQELREFGRLYKKLDELYHSLSLKMGMSDSTFSILYTISELGDGCSQKEICAQISASKQTINSAIRKLEQDGIICLKKGEKGRELHICLTGKGRQEARAKIYPLMEAEDRAFIRMPAKDRAEFLRLSRMYVEQMFCETKPLLESEEST